MELNIADRLMLMSMLAGAEGNITLLRTVREHQARIGFSDEELDVLGFKQSGNQTVWNKAADVPVEIEIGDQVKEFIVARLNDLNDQGKLTMAQLGLYEKFVPEGN